MLRVDTAPRLLRPLLWLYGVLMAAGLLLAWGLLKLSVRVAHVGRPVAGPVIDCLWHEALFPYFVSAMPFRRPMACLNHPAWYMKGVHLFLRVMGVRVLVLGSSGHGGREALTVLIPHVRAGHGSFMNPDGPAGPPRVLRDGALELSEKSGVPLLPISIVCSAAFRLPTWDRKLVPLPFSRLVVRYGPPRVAGSTSRGLDRAALKDGLDGKSVEPELGF